MKAYIAGPMRGIPAYNFPAFFDAEKRLTGMGIAVFNPARNDCNNYWEVGEILDESGPFDAGQWLLDNPQEFDLRAALAADLKFITEQADFLVVLPGWEASKGARAEVATAKAIGIPVHTIEGLLVRHEPQHDPSVDDWTQVFEVRQHPGPTLTPPAWPAYANNETDDWEALADIPFGMSVESAKAALLAAIEELEAEQHEADLAASLMADEEVRVTSASGGQKGQKLAAFDQVSPEVERLVAEHFGKGARKYDAHNFRKGYPWSLSYSALRRHLAAFWAGEEYDDHLPSCPEGCTDHTGSLHIVAVIWHAMVLTEFYLHRKEYDDRYGTTIGYRREGA